MPGQILTLCEIQNPFFLPLQKIEKNSFRLFFFFSLNLIYIENGNLSRLYKVEYIPVEIITTKLELNVTQLYIKKQKSKLPDFTQTLHVHYM